MRSITLSLERVCLHTLAKRASADLRRSGFSKSHDKAPQPQRGQAKHTDAFASHALIYRSGPVMRKDAGHIGM